MRVFAITFTLIIVLASNAFSDVIYFKDGGKVEGIIKEETEGRIIIDIGIGTMIVGQDEIEHIEKATPHKLEQLKKKKFEHEVERGEWAPAGCEDIRMLYCKARDEKVALQEARRRSQAIRREIARKEKRISELLDMLDKKGRELKGINAKKNVKKYNAVVAEMNSINSHLNKENSKVKTLYGEEKGLNANLSKMAGRYRNSFQLLKDALYKRHDDINENTMTQGELYFFETMSRKAIEMESDFKKDVALYTPEGAHIVVDALLEDSVSAQLMVDTGASIVLISTDVARRLGIKYEDIATQIDIVVADGRSVKAKPIILKSVKVGDAEVKNVQAAILNKDAIGGTDGLLGMSFLSHFIMSVDSAGNKLILERVL